MIARPIGIGASLRRPDAYTKLLLRGDGSGQTIKDLTGKTITPGGNATLSTTQRKFIGNAIYFDGTGDYLELADSDDWYFGTGPFSISAWVKKTTSSSICMLASTISGSSNGFQVFLHAPGLYFIGYNSDAGTVANIDLTWGTGWRYIVIERATEGGNVVAYVDGVAGTGVAMTIGNSTDTLKIGIDDNKSSYPMDGYIDELTIMKGKCVGGTVIPTRRK